jgi:hypothetical protein
MKKIISFSLWGDKPIYTVGAIANAVLAQEIYPGWICRFYIHRSSIPQNIIRELEKQPNVELVDMPQDIGWSGMLWRFYPAIENDVSIMISRDCDSRLSLREKACVDEWLTYKDKKVMTIRDTCVHQSQMMGGLWGVKDGFLKFIKPYLDSIIEKTKYTAMKGVDQDFLNNFIYLYSLGIVNEDNKLNLNGSSPDPRPSSFVSFDDIAFGNKRFNDINRRPHDREWLLPTPIQRNYGEDYKCCINCGIKHDNEYIGKCETLSKEECSYINLTEEQIIERENIIKYSKLYFKKHMEYGLSPLQHEHGSEKNI